MVQHISIHEAKTHLSRLIKEVEAGREIIITRSGKSVATLGRPLKRATPRIPDMFKGKFSLPDNFDDPMPEEWFEQDEFPAKPKPKRRKKK